MASEEAENFNIQLHHLFSMSETTIASKLFPLTLSHLPLQIQLDNKARS